MRDMRTQDATDVRMARLAGAQHGVVSRAQLLVLGFSRDDVTRRVRAARLHRVHRGVYAVGHRVLTLEGRWMAAVLAAGEDAALSHATAAAAWQMRPVGSGAIHVTIPAATGRLQRPGLRIHRSVTLTTDDVTTYRGIPVTDPHRTLVDLARTLERRPLEQALNRAERIVDFERLRRSAPPALQAVLESYTTAQTRSELEERFLRLCDDHGIPRPEVNARVEGIEVDFVWRAARFVVEVDGYAFHRSPSAFAADRERDVHLQTRGWRVARFTYDHVTHRTGWVADAVSTGARARAA
jgi:predicted transcriptional regulator of viral defense system